MGLSVRGNHDIWGQYRLFCYKKARYMGSIGICLLQESTLYGVNKVFSVTRRHGIWGQK